MPPAIESLVESLVLRLWGLVAIKVEAAMAAELASVQQALLVLAREHRERETEHDNAVADRLEASSERLARAWLTMEELLCAPPASIGNGGRRSTGNVSSPAQESADGKRSRGRPRKGRAEEPVVTGQNTRETPLETPAKELFP